MKILQHLPPILLLVTFSNDINAQSPAMNTAQIESITGLKGKYNESEKVFKVSSPRTDMEIHVDKWKMQPFMGLTSWASFMLGKETDAMIMGDLVLFEDEVNPVMSAALDSGIHVTALHNHFFYDNPRIYFMHIGGEGTIEKLAKGVRSCFDAVRGVRKIHPQLSDTFSAKSIAATSSITGKPIEDIFQLKGEAKDGMFKVVIGREVEMKCGCKAGKEMGVNTWAAFAGTDENTVVDGDFAVLETELQGVLKNLRHAGINIVAIHHHMIDETPRMLFLHYWGRGKAQSLARAVKNALPR